jgi:hypothetical protein
MFGKIKDCCRIDTHHVRCAHPNFPAIAIAATAFSLGSDQWILSPTADAALNRDTAPPTAALSSPAPAMRSP